MMPEQAYEARFDELVAFLRGTLPADHPYAGAVVLPELAVAPEIWSCGSRNAALLAARRGTHFCCTLFHGAVAGPEHVELYRREFQPSAELARPHAMIAVAGACAEREDDAHALARRFPLRHYVPSLVGTPAQCGEKLAELRSRYGVDEIMLLDISPSLDERLRSLALLAEAVERRRAA
jgi:alkanesulfonate monooxygenase SsuD/methylene tetrahydromethanopterin reductase-like flavin-dependent oxidoreductase (luciferase family)